jgi:AcrR family transcriptional regulator
MPRPSDPLARIKLLVAAEAEFVEHGLDGAKVEQITRRAGISKGAFYLHFSSKTQLFRELVESFVARLATLTDAGMEQCDAQADCPPDVLIDQWVSMDLEVFEFLWQNRGLIRLLLEGGSGAQFRYLVDDFLERMVAKSRHVIEQCMRKGLYRDDLDLDLAADVIAGAYDRLARKIVRQPTRTDLRPALEHMQDMILFGLASASFTETLAARRGQTAASAEPLSRVRPQALSTSRPAARKPTLETSTVSRSSAASSSPSRTASRRQQRGPR